MPKHLSIDVFDYPLPEERIAKYPLAERDASKLLHYRAGAMTARGFRELPALLPEGTLLVFNNTRVIHARLHFTLPNGKPLEILCLDPLDPPEHQLSLSATHTVHWKCLIGGNRKWKSGEISQTIDTPDGPVHLTARRVERLDDAFAVAFTWDATFLSFGEVLAAGGIIPLPPYLNRESEDTDRDRYQTIYAEPEGSVAAPTAGLHFTDRVFRELDERGIRRGFVTLHVGAGTFKPVKADQLGDHDMHQERIFVHHDFVRQLATTLASGQPVVPVGTTSLRTLESLYWWGVRCTREPDLLPDELFVSQWEPYETAPPLPAAAEALRAIDHWMGARQLDQLEGNTQLLIAPGYPYHLISGLITNFHQPRSTLLLLVAALIGDDWKKIYDFALAHDFRFLSYGDSSLIWKQ
ncbi:MAG: S-adenosylmethionine:tRNA ribosyltransferase-isomerase [Lewinella sp.]|nr:S-adenosylmethionine:tRNA ribosyltransferase-isomerase [Lewinella sp.]